MGKNKILKNKNEISKASGLLNWFILLFNLILGKKDIDDIFSAMKNKSNSIVKDKNKNLEKKTLIIKKKYGYFKVLFFIQ